MMKNRAIIKISALALGMSLLGGALLGVASFSSPKAVEAASNYEASEPPTTIYLRDNDESEIRAYYSALDGRNLNGNDLLIALKPILKNNQKYYKYDGSSAIWKIYEISDRDWALSPATALTSGQGSYDAVANEITNYKYGSSYSNPYVHALYVDRTVDNPMRAWGNHSQGYGGINREHIWPKSRGFDNAEVAGARGDPMHLWAADGYTNNIHSNFAFGEVSSITTDCSVKIDYSVGNYLGTSKTLGSGTVFEPCDADKGDIARACFYMAARYNNLAGNDNNIDAGNPNLIMAETAWATSEKGTSTAETPFSMGVLSDLLKWNEEDPPDKYEIHRNNLLFNNFTNNRNPFIDFPGWANIIWGGESGVASPAADVINDFGDPGEIVLIPPTSIALSESSITVLPGSTETVRVTSSVPANAVKTVTWSSSNTSVATVSEGVITGVANGNAVITATSTENSSVKATINVNVGIFDVLNPTNLSLGTISYGDFDSGECVTGARYVGNAMKGNSAIQLRASTGSQAKSGIVMTQSGGYVRSVVVDWESNTAEGRTLQIFGKNTAYSSAADLYSDDKDTKGELLGTIVNGTSTVFNSSSKYLYIGMRSSSNSMYLTSISITFGTPVSGITISDTALTMEVGEEGLLSASVTPSYAENPGVNWSSSNSDVVSVTSAGAIVANAEGSATITAASDDNGAITASCAITVVAPEIEVLDTGEYFKKVTSVSELKEGDHILLAAEKDDTMYALSTIQNTNNRTALEIEETEDGILDGDSYQTITLGKSGDNWTLYTGSGYLYAASSSKNYLKTEKDLDDNGKWTISINGLGEAVITAQGSNTHNVLQFNEQDLKFSCYTGTQNDVFIYKSYRYEAERYCDAFLHTYTAGCNSSGGFEYLMWGDASTKFAAMTNTAKGLLRSAASNEEGDILEQCAARYDYIVLKYGVELMDDFMLRNPSSPAFIATVSQENSKTVVYWMVIIAIVSLVPGTVFFIRHRRRED